MRVSKLAITGSALTVASTVSAPALAGYEQLNMTEGVTPISQDAYDLHMLILWICVAIGVVVFGAMFWSMWKHRKANGVEPAQFHHSTKAEIIWTVIPVLILVGMAIPATRTLINMEDSSDPDLTIKITGYQWKWKYDYLGEGVSFYSNLAESSRAAIFDDPSEVDNYLLDVDNRVVIPTNKKVRFLITADDVIHSWWVPQLGMKRDAIPGFMNEMWARVERPGVYRGQCTELCGKDHGFMPIVVEAKTPEDYQAWLAEQQVAKGSNTQSVVADADQGPLVAKGKPGRGISKGSSVSGTDSRL
jgi:cytochrome c oxidase subunit 2